MSYSKKCLKNMIHTKKLEVNEMAEAGLKDPNNNGRAVRVEARPYWDTIFNAYPTNANDDRYGLDIYDTFDGDGNIASMISACRVSIAFTGDASMKKRLNDLGKLDILRNLNNSAPDMITWSFFPVHPDHPLNILNNKERYPVKVIIRNVEKLKKWLEQVWGNADEKIICQMTMDFEHKEMSNGEWIQKHHSHGNFGRYLKSNGGLGNRKGIFIIMGPKGNCAALWDGRKLVGGYNIYHWLTNRHYAPTTIYFWRLRSKQETIHEAILTEQADRPHMWWNAENGHQIYVDYDVDYDVNKITINCDCERDDASTRQKFRIVTNFITTNFLQDLPIVDRLGTQEVMRIITLEKKPSTHDSFILKEKGMTLADITGIVSDGATEHYNNRTPPVTIDVFNKVNTAYSLSVGVIEATDEFNRGKIEHGMFKLIFPVAGILIGGVATVGAGLPIAIIASVVTVFADNYMSRSIEQHFLSYTGPFQRYKMPNRTGRIYNRDVYSIFNSPNPEEWWKGR
jgi:hypothetical protein